MNKKLKIATAAVSVVMAGTMAFGMFGCTGGKGGSKGTKLVATNHNVESIVTSGDGQTVDTKTVGGLSFYTLKDTSVPAYTTSTTLNMNICDSDKNDRHITFHTSQISTEAVLPDGEVYSPGDLKPAWAQLSKDLGVKFSDKAQNRSSEKQITDMIDKEEQALYHIVTGSGSAITNKSDQFIDLNQFLDYMPNYKAFLDANPIVKWSLTTNTTSGAMYYAPYFDGDNDIEKYVLTHKEWTRAMLDAEDVSAATTTWADSKVGKADVGVEQTYATGIMGTEGSYEVDTTDPADETKLVKLVVNYEAAKAASSATKAAYNTAVGSAYTGESGNIVDIMNAAITATSGNITGAKLLSILRAYIDEVYQTEAGGKFYETRSDVFNSVSAGWDVDLYTALSRCVVTSYKLFGTQYAAMSANQIYALSGRQATTQRRADLISFVGELYGVRGLESRNEFAYVDANGDLQDAREDAASYDAMNKFSALTKEGLVYTGETNIAKYAAAANSIVTFSMHDYSQTQTQDGFYLDVDGFKGSTEVPAGLMKDSPLQYDFAPILTPVAKWDTDSNGEAETIMRFTESWRAVKNTGFCVPKASVQGKPEQLSAVLAFIDHLFSNDGQIIATYGQMSTNGNTAEANGFWYGNYVADLIDGDGYVKSEYANIVETHDGIQYVVKKAYKSQYFTYANKLYTGYDYLGTQVPVLTDNNKTYFYGKEITDAEGGKHKMGESTSGSSKAGMITNQAGSYTDYCRAIIGGALPIGNKSQGFEFQATSGCSLAGTAIVSQALLNGAIKHLTQEVSADTYWYTCVPTTLPVNSTDGTTLDSHINLKGSDDDPGLFLNTSKTAYRTNLYLDLMFYGYGADKPVAGNAKTFQQGLPADAAACLVIANNNHMDERASIYAKGWTQLKTAFMG